MKTHKAHLQLTLYLHLMDNGEKVSEQEILVYLSTYNEQDVCPDGTKPDEDDEVGDNNTPTWQFTAELYEADQDSIFLEEFFGENNLEDVDISTSDLNISSSDIKTSTRRFSAIVF